MFPIDDQYMPIPFILQYILLRAEANTEPHERCGL